LGASGGILRLADVIPEQCVTLYNDFLDGEWKRASKLQRNIIPLNNAIIQKYGIAGAKYAMDLLGFYGGFPRNPILPLDADGKNAIETVLKRLNLIT
jgi:4-hydroxy-2-oxoglutarate aldolase